jgi:hypothetical protein
MRLLRQLGVASRMKPETLEHALAEAVARRLTGGHPLAGRSSTSNSC